GGDGMARQEQPEGLALSGQALRLAQIGDRRIVRSAQAEQVYLADAHGAEILFTEMHGALELRGKRRAIRTDAIQAAGPNQRLEHAPIDPLQIDAATQIRKTLVRAVGSAFF